MTVTSWSILHLVSVVEFLFGHLWPGPQHPRESLPLTFHGI
jgi:hypothetical protein